METKKPREQKMNILKMIDEALPCYFVKWQNDVQPYQDAEPVGQFSLKSASLKYIVDGIYLHPQGLIWKVKGEINIASLSSYKFVRITLC